MSLVDISNVVLLLNNPAQSSQGSGPSTVIKNISAISNQMAYSSRFAENLVTLASSYVTSSQNIQGLLYVPDLSPKDPCHKKVASMVPSMVTRRANLPPASFNLVGLAPWISTECTRSYLASARVDPIRAFIFYRDTNSTDAPPPADADLWDLDEDDSWKIQNRFPVFAVPGRVGAEMMTQLSLYSGNITTVPFGDEISNMYDPREEDYVRIWTTMNVNVDTSFSTFWISIPIFIGVLVGIVLATSIFLHCVARKRRSSLRKRVQTGEVNLEALGIKRVKVPLNHVHNFPIFTYANHYDNPPPGSPTLASAPSTIEQAPSSTGLDLNSLSDQPECLICLQPYVDRETIIRELPCGHIFHPDCIDEFLSEFSSLCPLCKTCMLPKGYSPRITNNMVRREIATRKLRERIVISDDEERYVSSSTDKKLGLTWGSTRKKHAPRTQPADHDRDTTQPDDIPGVEGRASPKTRTRRRMRELAGPDIEGGLPNSQANQSIWQKTKGTIFPQFKG
ncbi:hypothetical protein MCOR27_011425 [Pyricularia oryzae]|uniref:RING-type domain-containing protein n=2 Tax=Pyricularia TaxID=48558 RepID=A0ABQ8NLP0_PYRGI|nr:hypothetical protein MCOR01_010506 [Pyricularia oryzae]KAI6297717.1 hypothetical protein MCOR33_006044 [Pyricularia grisea]KAI6261020.1 hypothetical protein MCOR19_002677 [Pyricularia oryzae]KAI6265375.1 hypothetical protein MCOR27_011425 [Pyricularia oryzae]KAI6281445.1 hypothetical protein MCOR26_003294 [Pyricularia oryzae]